jgi:hypothetical protein
MRTICGAVYFTCYTFADNCVDSALSGQIASTDGTAVQFKDGISGGESIQTEPDGNK